MADLAWFPYDVAAWDARVRELRLSFEAEGILMRLLRGAWASDVPCTILDTDDELARLLGAKWKRGVAVRAAHFVAAENGRLVCPWLLELWQRQQAKHESYVTRGGKGGRPKKDPPPKAEGEPQPKAEVSDSKAEVSAELPQSSTEGISSGALRPHRANPPAPGGAQALEGARAAGAGDPLEREYFERLTTRAEQWIAKNADAAAELERTLRAEMGLPVHRELSRFQATSLRERLYDAIREQQRWPDSETYVAQRRAVAAEPELAEPPPSLALVH